METSRTKQQEQVQAALTVLSHAGLAGFEFKAGPSTDDEFPGCRWDGYHSDVDVRVAIREREAEHRGQEAIAEGRAKLEEALTAGAEMARAYFKELTGDEPKPHEHVQYVPSREVQLKYIDTALITAAFSFLYLDEILFMDILSSPELRLVPPLCGVHCTGDDVDIWLTFSHHVGLRELVEQRIRETWAQGLALRAAVDAGSHVSMAVAMSGGQVEKIDGPKETT
jgi:hypothetical protein